MKFKLLLVSIIGIFLTACDSSDSGISTPQASDPPASLMAPKAPLC